MNHSKKDFLPAAHYHALTPFYGHFMTVFFKRHYSKLAQLIQLKPGERLLDVGCGPGNLLQLIQKKHPKNKLVGLDVDPDSLKIAQKNLPQTTFHESSAIKIPEPDASFNVVTSTLMFHHLKTDEKKQMLKEVYRVLKPGGQFYLFDFCKPTSWFGRFFVKLFREVENMDEALEGKYKVYLQEAGFTSLQSGYRAYGVIELLTAIKS